MKTKLRVWLIVVAICVLAGLLLRRHFDSNSYVSGVFGGEANMQVVANPERVQAWRTVGFLNGRGAARPDAFFLKGGEAVAVPASLAKQLSRRLLSFGTYEYHPGMAKGCIANPGFVVTFSRGEQSVDVFFCFECDILIVKLGGSADFDSPHNELLRLIKLIFPNDLAVQGVPERRR